MQKRKILFIFIICLMLGNSFWCTEDATAMTDYTAKELMQLITSGQPIFLLNPLSEIEFNEAHIDGSVNIPAEQIYDTNDLPEDKNTLIVTYCKGPK